MLRRCFIAAALTAALVAGPATVANAASDVVRAPAVTQTEQARITLGRGIFLNLWGHELGSIFSNALRADAGGMTAACATANVPAPQAKLIKVICAAGGAVLMNRVNIMAVKWHHAFSRGAMGNSCWQTNPVFGPTGFFRPVPAKGNCR